MFSAETKKLIADAAERAGLEPPVLMALVDVESGGRTHTVVNGRPEPLIRFEGHYFDRRLSGRKRELARREGLAAPVAGAVKNPRGQATRWRLLQRAAAIDRRAAYESTSWGIGQVMGAHWAWLGYASVEALVDEARSGVEGQLDLMLRYIVKAGLLEPLRRREWAVFARGYNGPNFARKGYHLKLSLAYRRHARAAVRPDGAVEGQKDLRRGSRGDAVRSIQTLLFALGYAVAVDGDFGPHTHEAVMRFQRDQGLPADGIASPAIVKAMEEALPVSRARRGLGRMLRAIWRRVWGSSAPAEQ